MADGLYREWDEAPNCRYCKSILLTVYTLWTGKLSLSKLSILNFFNSLPSDPSRTNLTTILSVKFDIMTSSQSPYPYYLTFPSQTNWPCSKLHLDTERRYLPTQFSPQNLKLILTFCLKIPSGQIKNQANFSINFSSFISHLSCLRVCQWDTWEV